MMIVVTVVASDDGDGGVGADNDEHNDPVKRRELLYRDNSVQDPFRIIIIFNRLFVYTITVIQNLKYRNIILKQLKIFFYVCCTFTNMGRDNIVCVESCAIWNTFCNLPTLPNILIYPKLFNF